MGAPSFFHPLGAKIVGETQRRFASGNKLRDEAKPGPQDGILACQLLHVGVGFISAPDVTTGP